MKSENFHQFQSISLRVKVLQPLPVHFYTDFVRSTPPSQPNNIRGGNVRVSVITSVCSSTKSFTDLNEIWYVDRGQ